MMDKRLRVADLDWILLPAIGLVTIVSIVAITQIVAGRLYSESAPFPSKCMASLDYETGWMAMPNSVCVGKIFESEPVEYRFNSCGHRTALECGTKPPGTFRIVMIGSSFAMGGGVPQEMTFAARLPTDLERILGRKIDIYNEAIPDRPPYVLAQRAGEIMAAKPDLILWVITPVDISMELDIELRKVPKHEEWGLLTKAASRMGDALKNKSAVDAVGDIWNLGMAKLHEKLHTALSDTASGTLLLHLIYLSRGQFVKSALADDDGSGYLRSSLSLDWQIRLHQFEIDDENIERSALESGVPLVAVLMPTRAQSAVASMGRRPADVDPFRFDDELRKIVTRHGGRYVDIVGKFCAIPDAERYFYTIDGHPTADGHAVIASLLADALTSGAVPSLEAGGK